MNPLIQPRRKNSLFVIALLLASFELMPLARAVVPAPDGGYPGGNTAEGQNALFSLTTGGFNTGVGFFALRANATGQFNTAVGAGTLLANIADRNTAIGAGALLTNSRGHDNTTTGVFALLNNTTGQENTADGGGALLHNAGGSSNTAIGTNALFANTSGSRNTASGISALQANTTGNVNTATGDSALFANTTGNFNTAIGGGALVSNTTGHDNTAIGLSALNTNATGSNNIALGVGAGLNLKTGDNNIFVGSPGGPDLDGTIFIGDPSIHVFTVIAGIFGASTAGGIPVYIDANHRLGTMTSSERFKRDIKPMEQASEALFSLKPVTFRYKSEIDPGGTSQFGLIAEDVAKVNADLIVRDKEAKPYSVRYDQVNAMLLNEFLKEHRKNEEQQTTIVGLKATVSQLQKQIEILTAGLQKVSAQLELNRPARQLVNQQ
jgi:hypothetical protein